MTVSLVSLSRLRPLADAVLAAEIPPALCLSFPRSSPRRLFIAAFCSRMDCVRLGRPRITRPTFSSSHSSRFDKVVAAEFAAVVAALVHEFSPKWSWFIGIFGGDLFVASRPCCSNSALARRKRACGAGTFTAPRGDITSTLPVPWSAEPDEPPPPRSGS